MFWRAWKRLSAKIIEDVLKEENHLKEVISFGHSSGTALLKCWSPAVWFSWAWCNSFIWHHSTILTWEIKMHNQKVKNVYCVNLTWLCWWNTLDFSFSLRRFFFLFPSLLIFSVNTVRYSELELSETQRNSNVLFSLFAGKCTVSDKNSLLEWDN